MSEQSIDPAMQRLIEHFEAVAESEEDEREEVRQIGTLALRGATYNLVGPRRLRTVRIPQEAVKAGYDERSHPTYHFG